MNAVEIQNLSFRYADGAIALHDVSLTVAEGESVALIGPNGAGKSTLLLHLNGLLPETPAQQSCIRIFGQPATRENLPVIRRQVGFLFQDPDDQLFCPTVAEDVAFGPMQMDLEDAEIQQRIQRGLRQAGLSEAFADRPPHHLSGGEKRRVCLAGVLACDSKILVLDEPTSDLDPRGRREFKHLLRQLRATKIIATHDLELVVELCPRAIVMDGGRIVADGPTMELLSNEPFMLEHGLEKPHILHHLHPHH